MRYVARSIPGRTRAAGENGDTAGTRLDVLRDAVVVEVRRIGPTTARVQPPDTNRDMEDSPPNADGETPGEVDTPAPGSGGPL